MIFTFIVIFLAEKCEVTLNSAVRSACPVAMCLNPEPPLVG